MKNEYSIGLYVIECPRDNDDNIMGNWTHLIQICIRKSCDASNTIGTRSRLMISRTGEIRNLTHDQWRDKCENIVTVNSKSLIVLGDQE